MTKSKGAALKAVTTTPREAPAEPLPFDEIAARKKPRRAVVPVPMDGELVVRVEHLERELLLAVHEQRADDAKALVRELQDARADVERDSVDFELQAIGHSTFRKLLDLHPPRDRKSGDRFDSATFLPALLAATCVSPLLTTVPRGGFMEAIRSATTSADLRPLMAPALELWDSWDIDVAYLLAGRALEVNEGHVALPRRSSRG